MASSGTGSIQGLLVSLLFIIFVLFYLRRASKKKRVYVVCPICHENIQFGFRKGLPAHTKAVHNDYWRWRWKSGLFTLFSGIGGFAIFFTLIGLNIIPAHMGQENEWTFIGFGIFFICEFSLLGFGIAHQIRISRRVKNAWSEQHPLYQRSYGNLRGIEVQIKHLPGSLGKAWAALTFLDPATIAVRAGLRLESWRRGKKLGTVILDKLQDGNLWYYDDTLFHVLTHVKIAKSAPIDVDDQRIRIALKRGRWEVRTENTADLELIRTVFKQEAQSVLP